MAPASPRGHSELFTTYRISGKRARESSARARNRREGRHTAGHLMETTMRDHVGEASPEREHGAALRVALLAAVDDVLSRHRTYARHSGEDVEVLPDVEQVYRRLPQLVVKAGEVRSILSPGRLNPRLVQASYEAMQVALHGEISIRMLCTTDLADNGATAGFAETATTVGAEVRACVGPPNWLTIIGGSAIVVPRDPDDLDIGAVVIRMPGAVAVAGWAFEQAWRRAGP